MKFREKDGLTKTKTVRIRDVPTNGSEFSSFLDNGVEEGHGIDQISPSESGFRKKY